MKRSRWRDSNPRPADYESAAIKDPNQYFDELNPRRSPIKDIKGNYSQYSPITFSIEDKTSKRHKQMTSHARKITEGRYYFDLESIRFFSDVIQGQLRPKTRDGTRRAIYQLLLNGENVEIQKKTKAQNAAFTKLSAEIDYNAVKRFNDYANGLKVNTTLTYVKQFLSHFGMMWDDPTLKSWSEGLSYRAKKTGKRSFATIGSKADIEDQHVIEDIRRYYDALISQPKTIQEHQGKAGIYRNLVTLLFGITTGIRSEELDRLEWKDYHDAEEEYEIIFEDGARAIKPKHCFILIADKTKTHIDRIIPIHPDIKPYLSLLEEMYPNKPYDAPNYKNKRKAVNARLQIRQFRNFTSKYFNDFGFDEFRRIAIMGHDDAKLTDEAKRIAASEGVSKLYRKYSPPDIVNHYLKTVGKQFNPIPDFVDFKQIQYRLTTSYKEQKKITPPAFSQNTPSQPQEIGRYTQMAEL
jgi:integrase